MRYFEAQEPKRLESLTIKNQSTELLSTCWRGSSYGSESKTEGLKDGTLEDASVLKIVIPKSRESETEPQEGTANPWVTLLSHPGLISYSKTDPEYRRQKVRSQTLLTDAGAEVFGEEEASLLLPAHHLRKQEAVGGGAKAAARTVHFGRVRVASRGPQPEAAA